jgi:hypothetical protein
VVLTPLEQKNVVNIHLARTVNQTRMGVRAPQLKKLEAIMENAQIVSA